MTIIHRRNEFRANGQNVAQLKNNHVHVLLDYEILDIVDNQLICQTNQTHEISKLPFDTIIVQYGQVINGDGLKIFKGLAVNENKRVLVDAAQRTSLPNIYAIGNLCIYEGKPSSIICAHGEAAVAIRHILNDIKAYDRPKTH
jgi:thioredoxin reductase (NADPH)